jgi:enolase
MAANTLFDGRVSRFGSPDGPAYRTEQAVALYGDWVRQFPIASIEDGLAETDREGWPNATGPTGTTWGSTCRGGGRADG